MALRVWVIWCTVMSLSVMKVSRVIVSVFTMVATVSLVSTHHQIEAHYTRHIPTALDTLRLTHLNLSGERHKPGPWNINEGYLHLQIIKCCYYVKERKEYIFPTFVYFPIIASTSGTADRVWLMGIISITLLLES